ncbi:MAG: virulence RhuM family protein [Alphaproteobacteria bacterium]|nr:virulence RhuM family protein [Alphaproteobacteria bacterium]
MSSNLPINPDNAGELLLYQTEDGLTRVEAKMVNESVWLSLGQMADLFQRDKSVISRHISNIFEEGELSTGATVAKFATVQTEGDRQVQREVEYYNLDVIISVGYRVKSHRGTQFRIWATQRLREYIIKGFAMDDERLKQAGGGNYFDELLARIRDIRSSEKVFWKKVLDIYATSIDYDPHTETSQEFFAVVQNKMHWAAHGHTAAEIIKSRADASKPHMGMTSFTGEKPKRTDARIAKNYLTQEELETLNRLVNIYLEFAELRAIERRPMYMKDWITKLDDFLRLSERDILTHAGKISNEAAIEHANAEFDKYKQRQLAEPSVAEKDFEKSLKQLEKIEATAKKEKKGGKK